ncbi:nitroreductase family protein [uncultured Selenomonas sp.]|uniref:nitroreductase family protein n=1 Tax=uncultured Selenomonas sp. TaxID=159275 RepID=UPI0025DE70B0|nr:nitroreductase family protein [uncultured Selenomonas sp.]
MDAIFERMSIRKYEDRPVEQEKIEKLLRAAMAAPSAVNQQPWEFYVVKNRETMRDHRRALESEPVRGLRG